MTEQHYVTIVTVTGVPGRFGPMTYDEASGMFNEYVKQAATLFCAYGVHGDGSDPLNVFCRGATFQTEG